MLPTSGQGPATHDQRSGPPGNYLWLVGALAATHGWKWGTSWKLHAACGGIATTRGWGLYYDLSGTCQRLVVVGPQSAVAVLWDSYLERVFTFIEYYNVLILLYTHILSMLRERERIYYSFFCHTCNIKTTKLSPSHIIACILVCSIVLVCFIVSPK